MNSRQKSENSGQVRITGGNMRGRKAAVASIDGLRPTGDRAREVLFNWLQFDIQGRRVLDLFAGSGILSFEALSRGAASATLIEKSSVAFKALTQNCEKLSCDQDQATLTHIDATTWLESQHAPLPYDLIFVDPPYAADLLSKILKALQKIGFAYDDVKLYVETDQADFKCPTGFELIKSKKVGGSYCLLLSYTKS